MISKGNFLIELTYLFFKGNSAFLFHLSEFVSLVGGRFFHSNEWEDQRSLKSSISVTKRTSNSELLGRYIYNFMIFNNNYEVFMFILKII